ncbi:hypothetical protein CH352_04540 [Leptospira hartskeerlii]|uniref:Uncharacterized protein n=1 Tax=Leptospira hartskeerlii TaxID=2023177 RepID=A0A2M9XG28_9LEPT|nr:hypothetical protein [Leptospira hartskeerlii]PJZ26648.1 hypothetical protein CH357_03915 [Leptospira hartskeerlii]PJZ34870.1 hypothetical protein CH352_04540 [Leptospira hartskeerlii]
MRASWFPKVLAIFLIFILGFSNCAVFNRNNTPLVVKVEENLVPEDTGKKIIAAPIFIPLGLVAGVLDLFIVHPIIRIPDAFNDTISLLWTPRGNGYVTNMGFLPISIVLTPIVFTLDLLARSSFDINGNVDRSRIESNPVPKKTVYEALESGDRATILALLKIPVHNWPPELSQKVIEKFRTDPEIVYLSLIRMADSISVKDGLKYDSYLITFLNRDLEVDRALGRYFVRSGSLSGTSAIVSILASEKVSKETEDVYISTLLHSGKADPVVDLVNLYLKTTDKKKKIIYEFETKIRYGYTSYAKEKEYESGFIRLLNKDPGLDEVLLNYYVRIKSSVGSEAMTKLLVSGQLPKVSLKKYISTILEIGKEKDIQIILEKFPTSGK